MSICWHISRHRAAFTLIELLAVISIVGILSAIVITAIGSVRTKAKHAACVSNVRQIGTALLLYANDNNGFGPPGDGSSMTVIRRGEAALLFGPLLPYLSVTVPNGTITQLDNTPSVLICPDAAEGQLLAATVTYPGVETTYWMNPVDIAPAVANRKKLNTLPLRRAAIADYGYWWAPTASRNHAGKSNTFFRLDGSVTLVPGDRTRGLPSWNWSALDDI